MLDAHGAKAAVLGVVQIRAANAAIGDAHLELLGFQGRQLTLFQSQIAGTVANDRTHGFNFQIGWEDGFNTSCALAP